MKAFCLTLSEGQDIQYKSPFAVFKVLAALEGQILSAVYCERPRFNEAIYFYFVYLIIAQTVNTTYVR